MTHSVNFVLVVTAENGRLRLVERIAERFSKLTMAHRREVQAIVTSVIVSLTLDMLHKMKRKCFIPILDTLLYKAALVAFPSRRVI